MLYSAEIRWFPEDHNCLGSIQSWFNEQGKEFKGNSRSDLYLATKNLPTHGIKIREGKLEIKVLHHDWGELAFGGQNTGKANMWCKYGFQLGKDDAEINELVEAFTGLRSVGINHDWIRFDKERLLVKYAIDPERNLVEITGGNESRAQGCNVELTRVTVNFQKQYHTFALEAFGRGVDLRKNLDLAVTEIFRNNVIAGLNSENSMSYPEFLGRL